MTEGHTERLEAALDGKYRIERKLGEGGMPEREIEAHLDNTWGDTAKAIVNNWLGLVYKFTDLDRRNLFMPGVDPEDPLGLRG